jgi:hypothetical protein
MCNVEYVAMATSVLIFISEILPFLDKHKSNGIIHFIYVCWNSDCLKENRTLKEPEDPPVEMREVIISSDPEVSTDDETDDETFDECNY